MQSFNDEYWMTKAITQAKLAEAIGEIPVGAVIVKDNVQISAGYNQMIQLHDPTAHAESIALREAGKTLQNYRLINTTLYVTLEPCMMCLGSMIHARINRIVFGAYDKKTGACGSGVDLINQPIHNHEFSVEGGVLAEECGHLLSNFFKQRRLQNKNNKN